MKHLILILLAILSVTLARQCRAADQTLMDWSFAAAADTLGWTSAGGTIGLDKAEGALTSTGSDCKLISPLFEIKATPWQFVEIEMKTDKSGQARLFYSNTTQEPYGGFRGELQTQFNAVGDGQFHKYVVFPCWQNQGKIIHIRLDPPGANNAVRSARIVELTPAKAMTGTTWTFADTAAGWLGFGMTAEPSVSRMGWRMAGTQDSMALSPALDCMAEDLPWLSLRLASKTPHRVLFRWVCADRDGLQSVPIDVKGGGKFHNYTVNLSAIPEWSGRIVSIGVTPVDTSEPAEIALGALALAESPVGPAEIRISRLGLADPVTRAGAKAKIVMEVENVGGSKANSVNAAVTLMSGDSPKTLPVRTAGSLAAGKTILFEWETTFAEAGEFSAAASASAAKVEPDQRQVQLRIYPRLDKAAVKGSSYVPEPKIANTGEYLVGCYYFPGWRDYGAWSVLNDFPERKPILGYTHDGNPEVVDWQISWALEHGINFFIYDWYWSQGSRSLEEGLHDGFLKSKYQDKMNFCLLWANHNGPGSHSEKDMLAVTKYWIDNYFKRPNYLKIDGKNVMVIFNPGGITRDMGADGAKAAFAKMKKLCEDSGVGGIYLVASGWGKIDWVQQLEQEGYDAISGYNYPLAGNKGQNVAPYSWMVDAYNDIWNELARVSNIPYIPICEAGWDSRPWHGPGARVRSGKSAELWQKMLSNAKAYDDAPGRKLPGGKKLVFCEAWNEFGEGDYIEPNAGDGFDYLEAIRRVFAPASKPPTIIVPQDIGMGPYGIAPPAYRTVWDFSKPDDRGWTPAGLTAPTFDSGVLATEATGTDPMLSALWVEIDASKFKTLEVKMKIDKPSEGQMFFTGKGSGLSGEKSVTFPVVGDNQFHTYAVDMTKNRRWSGTITGLRFDPTSVQGSKMEIAYIKFRQ
jgi:hypothetical protein